MIYLINWTNGDVFVKKINITEFKTLNIIVKHYREDKKESDYVTTFEKIFGL